MRAVRITTAYVGATAAILLTVVALRAAVPPATLRGALGVVFVAALAAGLEPGTVRAAALRESGAEIARLGAYLGVNAVKAVAASPFLAIIWVLADPGLDRPALLWAPAITAAGFCATDLRALLDLRGRYVAAILVKQGSLAGGIVAMGLLLVAGLPLFWAIGFSTALRLSLPAVVLFLRPRVNGGGAWTGGAHVARLLRDRRWVEIAGVSVIAAVSGSMDRVAGLRILSPAAYAAYYLIYESLTKFWVIPYVLSPILFARQAAGLDQTRFIRDAWRATALAGVGLLIGVGAVLVAAPTLVTRVIGVDLGMGPLWFAGAVALGSFGQLRVAELQGAGRSRPALLATLLSGLLCAPIFFVAARAFGAPGLMLAGLIKAAVELAALAVVGGAPRIPPAEVLRGEIKQG